MGDFIKVKIHPHRFEFVVSPGVDAESIHELASKIFFHVQGLSKNVDIKLLQRGKKVKHTTLIDKDTLHKITFAQLLTRLKRILLKTKKPKHLVLHQFNAVGGGLYSHTAHNQLFRDYFAEVVN